MNKKISFWFLQLFKIASGCFLSHFNVFLFTRRLWWCQQRKLLPYGSWRTARYLDEDNSFSVDPLSRSSSFVTSHVHSLLFSLSPALSRISSFFVLRTATVSHTTLPSAWFRHNARACAPVLYYRETDILSFRLSFLSCRSSTVDHTRPTRAWFSSSFSHGRFLISFTAYFYSCFRSHS